MKKRIWELDAFRGICVLGMVLVHLVYDLVKMYRIIQWEYPDWFAFVQEWGGVLFLLISGISLTLGSRSVRRGLIVFLCGLLVSAVTYGMYALDFAHISIIIYFGVLHCLGVCMLLGGLLRKLPWWALMILAAVFIILGFHFETLRGDRLWLMPLGITPYGFASSDYFPLFPNLGFFVAGMVLGKTLYRKKESLLPRVNEQFFLIRFLRFCGRHSLWIYLIHQPALNGLCMLLASLK